MLTSFNFQCLILNSLSNTVSCNKLPKYDRSLKKTSLLINETVITSLILAYKVGRLLKKMPKFKVSNTNSWQYFISFIKICPFNSKHELNSKQGLDCEVPIFISSQSGLWRLHKMQIRLRFRQKTSEYFMSNNSHNLKNIR